MSAVLVSHPTGNTFVRALLSGLFEKQMLHSFHTTVGFAAGDPVLHWLPEFLQRQLRRRCFDLPADKLAVYPARESLRLLCQAADLPMPAALSIDAVYRSFDEHVATCRFLKADPLVPSGVYCYEDGALETFKAAKARGLPCFYELPIAYWQTSRTLLTEEAARLPHWEKTLGATSDPPEKLQRKDMELELADALICPSEFVLKSLPEKIRAKIPCVVAPFGSPQVAPERACPAGIGAKLRVLFAGSMTQRKGLSDVFEAMKLIDSTQVELVVMGQPLAPMSFYRSEYADFTWERTRPHEEVLALMSSCDVLVLPSIVEGRALVQQEAMMCGLPIIVTDNAGGSDLVVEGQTGFLVPIRNPAALAEKISWCNANRAVLPEMSAAARQRAQQCTWSQYQTSIIRAISLGIYSL